MIGAMRDRAAFHRREETSDGYGNTRAGFAADPFLTVWGRLQTDRGRERVAAGRLEEGVAAVLTVRFSAAAKAVTPADKVVIDGEDWTIRSVIDADRMRRVIEMVVERGAAT